MPANPYLRALDPKTERNLFQIAYTWRSKPKKNRLSFEDFAKVDPSQITLGLFNGELQAVYFFHEIAPNQLQAHFTSSRNADKSLVLVGAATLVKWFQENGLEMVAYVHKRNKPLRDFVESAGLFHVEHSDIFSLQDAYRNDTVPATTQLWVEYRSKVTPAFGPFRQQETEIAGHNGDDRKLRISDAT